MRSARGSRRKLSTTTITMPLSASMIRSSSWVQSQFRQVNSPDGCEARVYVFQRVTASNVSKLGYTQPLRLFCQNSSAWDVNYSSGGKNLIAIITISGT